MEINKLTKSSLRVKKSVLRKIKVNDVMKELKANNYFDKAHHEMLASIKDTLAYKQMKEVAVSHMFNTLTNCPGFPDAKAREEKRNQVSRIGALAIQISSSISKIVSQRLSQEGAVTAKKALKRLSDKKSKYYDYMNRKKYKEEQNHAPSEFMHITNEKDKVKEKDSVSDVSLNISENSVSSVHTSDLSSFDEEMVISSEDEKGRKKKKRISFRTANKAYFGGEFSNIHNLVVRQKILGNKESVKTETEKKFLYDICKNSASKFSSESEIGVSRPKRARKPNSKYSPEDMYL